MTAHLPAPHNGNEPHLSGDYPPLFPENEIEVTRLLMQHRRLSELLGGILPESLDLSNVQHVLDVACGAGGWVFDMARNHPTIQITGIDKSKYFIEQARKITRDIPNVNFLVQNIPNLEQTILTPGTFDLINMSFLAREISPQEFPLLLQALTPLSPPGGIIHWRESELPLTNSPAYQQLTHMLLEALQIAGRSFSPSKASLGVTSFIASLLRNAGYHITQDIPHAIDISTGTAGHPAFLRQTSMFGHQIRPFLLATGVITERKFEELFQQSKKEISEDKFCGVCFLRAVVGVKRREDDPPEPFRW